MAKSILTDRKFYVYVHSRLTTGEPFYIGKGRLSRVTTRVGRSAHWNRIDAKDLGCYINVIFETSDEELAFLVEVELINKHRMIGVELINQTCGGEGMSGYRMTPEQIANQSKAKMGNKANLGRKDSEETKAIKSAAQRARTVWPKLSDEHKEKIGLALRGNQHCLGKKASDETKAKLSAFQKGKQHTLGHVLTDDHKAKVSASLIGNKRNLGNKASAETIMKLSAAQKAAWARRKVK